MKELMAPMEWVGEEESARNLHEHEQDSILPSCSSAFYPSGGGQSAPTLTLFAFHARAELVSD